MRNLNQLPFALLLASAAVACTTPSTQSASQVSSDLAKTNGGYDTADEAPMFGDETEFDAAAIETDTAYTDSMAQDPTVLALSSSTTASIEDVIVLWGKLPGDPGTTDHRDWTGSLSLSRGALVVNRTVAFEPATDHLLPRSSPASVSFASVTAPFVDGLALSLLDPTPASTDAYTLTYTSAIDPTQSYAIDVAQLASGPVVVDAGDGYKLIAVALHRDTCHGGFMRGRFRALTANVGVYIGIVVDRLGQPIGHVRGIYGHKADGSPVMFGKFIDRDGKFTGLIDGTYDAGDFQAKWIDRAGDHGLIHGHYFEGASAQSGNFIARWDETSCSPD